MTPQRHRFHAATIAAWCIGGTLRTALAWSNMHRPRFSWAAEFCLARLLAAMDTAALPFDPIVCVSGMESLQEALGRGTILVATHVNAGLTRLVLRPLNDERVPLTAISDADAYLVVSFIEAHIAETVNGQPRRC